MTALLRCQTAKGEGAAQLGKGMFHMKRFLFPEVGVALPRIPRPHEGDPSWLPRRAVTVHWTVTGAAPLRMATLLQKTNNQKQKKQNKIKIQIPFAILRDK